MPLPEIALYIFLLAGAIISYLTRKLTLAGAITGAATGVLIYNGAGFTGIAMLALFFIAGTLATSWQAKQKAAISAAEEHKGGRTAGQVLANGGVAALLGALGWYSPAHINLIAIMIAGSFAAAMADTLSSELGTVYGKRFYHILTFKLDKRGLDGVVSLEGTLIGAVGAMLIALVYACGFGFSIGIAYIVVAGIIGNAVDSVLGAALERKHIIGNNVVNTFNTLTGALICLALAKLTGLF